MRISDADRSRAVDELRRHAAAGRLDLDAYATRIAEAMEAETLADLDHALRDLPTMRIADPSTDPPFFAPGGPGGHRLRARLVVVLSTLLLVVGVGFAVLAHWVWAGILVLGWIVGVMQGRVRIATRRRT